MELWRVTGKDRAMYGVSFDAANSSATLQPKPGSSVTDEMFGALVKTADAAPFKDKRIRFTAEVKTEDVVGWSGLWLRLDSAEPDRAVVGFDNMKQRAISGTTDWQTYEIVLDVPIDAEKVVYGILLRGDGKAHIRGEQLSEAALDVPVTAPAIQR